MSSCMHGDTKAHPCLYLNPINLNTKFVHTQASCYSAAGSLSFDCRVYGDYSYLCEQGTAVKLQLMFAEPFFFRT